jgi:hypothetical protein
VGEEWPENVGVVGSWPEGIGGFYCKCGGRHCAAVLQRWLVDMDSKPHFWSAHTRHSRVKYIVFSIAPGWQEFKDARVAGLKFLASIIERLGRKRIAPYAVQIKACLSSGDVIFLPFDWPPRGR